MEQHAQITRRWAIRPVEFNGATVVGAVVEQAAKVSDFDTVRRRKALKRAEEADTFVLRCGKPRDGFNGLGG